MGKQKSAIQPSREENYPEWYQQVIKAADLAENSVVRGCMVIKPWGYRIWENIQRVLDKKFKDTGHENAYFPLFIPLSYFQKEAEHVDGFAKECAVVTHHRLEKNKEGLLVPSKELEEPLIVRPTSEMIIGESFSKWIQSYRDLPLKMNQWANVVRWEMRTRIFLRTTEFLWQEGHTAHATREEAEAETEQILNIYNDFAHNYLAMPTIPGEKSELERFPGAVRTLTFEAMMQDRKALQAGTSHFLGQNFSKSCDIQFRSEAGENVYAWTTSWGTTTRFIGGMIMTHSDDDGLVLPPRVASSHIVILPVLHSEETKIEVLDYCHQLAKELRNQIYSDRNLEVIVDDREMRGGEKNWSWIKKGIPIRVEVGPRDIAEGIVCMARRDQAHRNIQKISREQFVIQAKEILEDIQKTLYEKALAYREEHTKEITNKEEFYDFFTPKNKNRPEIHGGFALCHFCEDAKVEQQIQEDLNVTLRCIPLDLSEEKGTCAITGRPSKRRVIFAKSY